MGKGEEEQNLSVRVGNEALEQNVEARRFGCGCEWIYRLIGLRCFLFLLLSAAVFLSALFWLPPFLQFADRRDLDLNSKFKGHEIVASFNVEKPVSFLEDNILQLENDIFDELGYPSAKVVIISLEPTAGSNITSVIFGFDPSYKYSKISPTDESLIRASFQSLVIHQLSLRLTKSLFGDPFSFEVLKFRGGITVIPPQSAFLLQKVQILFNFTLNFSIYQIQMNFNELTSQLNSGLHLAPYENLYISLSNSKGSTVAPPTTVQSSVLLAVGNTPSVPRLKQLAQTITGSHSGNLGLNNTVFGRVKQVSLSSILQHSLNGGDNSVAPTRAPSPAPMSHPHSHHHHHHHHHHRHHHVNVAPASQPSPSIGKGVPATPTGGLAPAPERIPQAPQTSYEAKPPGCRLRKKRTPSGKARGQPSHLVPTVAPDISPVHSAASPQPYLHRPTPPREPARSVPASSPLPNVVFAHAQPPSKSESNGRHTDATVSSPSPSPSSAGLLQTAGWAILLVLAIILHLLQQR